jgi:hypothetical protein
MNKLAITVPTVALAALTLTAVGAYRAAVRPTAAATTAAPAALDQHERHPGFQWSDLGTVGPTGAPALLDQHERHPYSNWGGATFDSSDGDY